MVVTFLKKYLFFSFFAFTLFLVSSVNSQEYIPLELAQNKVLNVFFPTDVSFCNAGIPDITYEIKGNMIILKAVKANFPETNLTVITTDNLCYSFLLLYNELPRISVFTADPLKAKKLKNKPAVTTPKETVIINAPDKTQKSTSQSLIKPTQKILVSRDSMIVRACKKLFTGKPRFYDIAMVKSQMALSVSDIAADDSTIYIVVNIQNNSSVDYIIAFVNFQVFESEKVYSKPVRNVVKRPVYIYNQKDIIKEQSSEKIIYSFDKFALAKNQDLYLELGEKNGTRMFTVTISPRLINKPNKI
jgi:hypothetical protein